MDPHGHQPRLLPRFLQGFCKGLFWQYQPSRSPGLGLLINFTAGVNNVGHIFRKYLSGRAPYTMMMGRQSLLRFDGSHGNAGDHPLGENDVEDDGRNHHDHHAGQHADPVASVLHAVR